jgi:predicted alpha/beta superfamily hydrolase
MTKQRQLSRRDFFKLGGTAALSLALPACNPAEPVATPTLVQIPPTVTAPPPQPQQVTIPATELFKLSSSIAGQEYRIFVALPNSTFLDSYIENPRRRYPVLYVLDANALFGMVTETVRIFNLLEVIDELIVVGIGYPVDTFNATLGFRSRDLTPKIGAAKFLQFIREELIPTIDATYRTSPGDNGILGHSFGGLFGLYALFNQPETFKRYIIGSPSISWDETVLLDAEKFVANKANVAASIFMSAGAAEEASMIGDMQKVSDMLQEVQSEELKLTTQIFEGEIHPSVVPAHISRGLWEVYG